tara:strand:- start:735 stop:926 length:192 start_codon:yes stop_codon:yes gene_type:complete
MKTIKELADHIAGEAKWAEEQVDKTFQELVSEMHKDFNFYVGHVAGMFACMRIMANLSKDEEE